MSIDKSNVWVGMDRYMDMWRDKGRDESWMELPKGKGGTLKSWFADREGQEIRTAQVTIDVDTPVAHWLPGQRIVTGVTPTYAYLDESAVEYKGTTVVNSDDKAILVAYQWGDKTRAVLFTTR